MSRYQELCAKFLAVNALVEKDKGNLSARRAMREIVKELNPLWKQLRRGIKHRG